MSFRLLIDLLLLSKSFEDGHFRDLKFRDIWGRGLFLAMIVFPSDLDLSGRIETKKQDDQNKNDWSYAHCFIGRNCQDKEGKQI
jgi:hypothetical protein